MKRTTLTMCCGLALIGLSAWAENRTVVVSDSEEIAIFDEVGTFNFRLPDNATGEARLLVVGGGGAGGANSGGGGGGGQYVYHSNFTLTPGQTYSCTVADGGAPVSNGFGKNGGTSSFSDGASVSVTAIGGGGGAGGWNCNPGKDGANGGGASGQGTGSSTPVLGGQPTVEGGFPGGNKVIGNYYSGGGGGAAGRGCNSDEIPTNGGPGLTNDITGVDVIYCYGGGGGGFSGSGYGGAGTGYGNGGTPSTPGEDGTGGGGGGGGYTSSGSGSDGGSGIVVIRYQLDTALPAANPPTVSRLANGQYRFAVETISGNAQVYAVFTDVVDGSAITNAVTSAKVPVGNYQADMTLPTDHAFSFAVLMQDGVHAPFTMPGEGVVFAGEVAIAKTADAYETGLVPGSFAVTRSSAESATGFDLTVTYSVGGSAVADRAYAALSGTVTIPAGESSATIAVTPLDDPETADDPTVVVTLDDVVGFVPDPDAASATLTIFNKSDFSYDEEFGFYPKTVTFTAAVGDPTLGIIWDFGDGSAPVETNVAVVTHTYTEPVKATVTMTYNGQVVTKEGAITICPSVLYVDAASTNPVAPYHTRATAATKVKDAVYAATNGATILIAPGDYPHGGSSRINITKALRILGEGESPTNTVLRSTSRRDWYNDGVMLINNADAFVANLTLADGWTSNAGWGGNLFIDSKGGTVSNCVIRGGSHNHDVQTETGGAFIRAGLITHSLFEGNSNSMSSTAYVRASAAVIIENGRIENCLFRNNRSPVGSVVHVNGSQAVLRNCTILDGTVGYYVSNKVTNQLYGVFVSNGSAINCAIADVKTIGYNDVEAGTPCPWGPSSKAAKFTHCAVDGTNAPSATCYLGTVDSFFTAGTLVPRTGGTLYNRGAAWATAPATDYLGRTRVFGKAIDIGCCESQAYLGLTVIIR